MGGLYSITTALLQRLKREHWGHPMNTDKLSDGELHDPGLQEFVDEFLAGLSSKQPVAMADTLTLIAPDNGPAITIIGNIQNRNINDLITFQDTQNNTYNTVTNQVTNVNNVNNITNETITNITENITNITQVLGNGTNGSITVVTGVSASVSVSGCTATITMNVTTSTINFNNGVATF